MSKVIGYCHNIKHTGYINKHLLQEHKCLEKQCPLFEKYNPSYWGRLEKERKDRQKLYKKAKAKKLQKQQRDEFIRSVFEPYKQIYITSVQEIYKGLKITYIYDHQVDLSEAIRILRDKYKCAIYLKAVRSSKENRKYLIKGEE